MIIGETLQSFIDFKIQGWSTLADFTVVYPGSTEISFPCRLVFKDHPTYE